MPQVPKELGEQVLAISYLNLTTYREYQTLLTANEEKKLVGGTF